MKNSNYSNDPIYLIIIIGFLSLILGTRLHDPFLHSFIALINGWELGGYTSGITTGSTDAIIYASQLNTISTFQFWIFFMFPPLFIFFLVIILTLIRTEKIIFIIGVILTSLNFASFDPSNKGSDSYNAVIYLTQKGWSETSAFLLQYAIFFIIIFVWLLYLYIIIENNPKDAKKRIRGLI